MQSAIVTMMVNCANDLIAGACRGEIRMVLENHLDTGLMGLSEAQNAAVKIMVGIVNCATIATVTNVTRQINEERLQDNKSPIFGNAADDATKAAVAAAAAATSDMLARAMKG